MTADVLSVDKARVSARQVLAARYVDVAVTDMLRLEYEKLKREVSREADKTFGDALPRTALVYLTYEEIFEPPKPAPAA